MTVTRLHEHREWSRAPNEATRVADPPMLGGVDLDDGPIDAPALWHRHWPTIRASLEGIRKQGLLLWAFDQQPSAASRAWVQASLDRVRNVVFGRHSVCGLRVPPDARDVSLRHLAFVVRASDLDQVRMRVIDLHTGRGFRDESGRVLHGAAIDGAAFFRVGRIHVVAVPTGDAEWPEDAEAAYRCLPERIFSDEMQANLHSRSVRVPPAETAPVPWVRGATRVESRAGPQLHAQRLCCDDEAPVGQLRIRSGGQVVNHPVGGLALRRGILFGRYDRCDVGAEGQDADTMSRVHLLILREQGKIWAFDTASTNGTFAGDKEVSAVELTPGTTVRLAGALRLTWLED